MMLWQITRENCWAYASAVLQIQGKRRLYSATNNELVDFYKWKAIIRVMVIRVAVRVVFRVKVRCQS